MKFKVGDVVVKEFDDNSYLKYEIIGIYGRSYELKNLSLPRFDNILQGNKYLSDFKKVKLTKLEKAMK